MFKKHRYHIVRFILGCITLGFTALTALVIIFPQSFIDVAFSHEIQEHQNPPLDSLMKLVSWFGYSPGSIIVVAAAALILLLFNYRREAVFVALTSLAGLVSTVVKILVNRPRPEEPIVHIVRKVGQQSFPSGHVLFYIVYFGFLTVLMYHLNTIPKIIRLAVSVISLLLIFAIPFSRIYLGAHWFTDVLGGFLLGMVCLYLLCFYYFKKPANKS
jgi:membrane-associated phospholipid phosphatase